jgi:hypothetical protein
METKILSKFLKTHFPSLELPTEKSVFFIINSISCNGCRIEIEKAFSKIAGTNGYFLLTSHYPNDASLLKKKNVYFDKNAELDRLNISISNVGFIVIEKNQITDIQEIDPEKLSPTLNRLCPQLLSQKLSPQ